MDISRSNGQVSASKRRKGTIEKEISISIINNEINNNNDDINNNDDDNNTNASNSQQHYSNDDAGSNVERILPETDDYSSFLPETPHQMSDLDENTAKLVLECLFRNSAFAWFSRKWIYIPNHSRDDARETYLNLFEKFMVGYKFIDEGLDADSVSIIKLIFNEINKRYRAFVLTSMDMGFDRFDRALRSGIRRFFGAINVDIKVFNKHKNKLYELECDWI